MKLSDNQRAILDFIAENYAGGISQSDLSIILEGENKWKGSTVTFSEIQRETVLNNPQDYGIVLK